MSFDKTTRNALAKMVSECRRLLTADIRDQLQRVYGLQPDGTDLPVDSLGHLDERGKQTAVELREWHEHLTSTEPGPETQRRMAAFDRLAHETAFTALNRLAALRLCEERGHVIECVRRGMESDGFKLFERLSGGALGSRATTYRAFLERMFDELAVDLGVLFDLCAPQSLVFPGETCLEHVLETLDDANLTHLWKDDETIGWIYQYFNPKEERDAMRKASPAPRNSRELAVRNQFFTPRYVVEFLTDNTLGRIWYEMRRGDTRLTESCRYLLRRPTEIFLEPDQEPPESYNSGKELSQEELLSKPAYVPFRAKKDPRDLKILDPACGSGHFLLYAFDLLEVIYEEAWEDQQSPRSGLSGNTLREDYPDLDLLRRSVPSLILQHNLHGIDIDPRCCQIGALALWLRAQRTYHRLGLGTRERPQITRSNIVCVEPMPGETELLEEFLVDLKPGFLKQLVRTVFSNLKLAGEAGSLLRIEDEIDNAIAEAKKQWIAGPGPEQLLLLAETAPRQGEQLRIFDVSGITDELFFQRAETRAIASLRDYANKAQDGSYRRRLFADDAASGFGFIDLCRRQHFDVILMNPPFGEPSREAKHYTDQYFPESRVDLFATFVERSCALLSPTGLLGVISSRTGFFLSSLEAWRKRFLLGDLSPTVVADLGPHVLDAASVETAAYCLSRQAAESSLPGLFFDLVTTQNKATTLSAAIVALTRRNHTLPIYIVTPESFRGLPGSPLSYWMSPEARKLFNTLPPLESGKRVVRTTIGTANDSRWIRAWWEIPLLDPAATFRWVSHSKGGAYSPYYCDLHLVLAWDDQRQSYPGYMGTVHRPDIQPASLEYFFQPGLTWPRRTDGLSFRPLPWQSIFGDKGPAIFVDGNDEAELVALNALLNSTMFNYLVQCQLARVYFAQSYEAGIIRRTPIFLERPNALSVAGQRLWDNRAGLDTSHELSHRFIRPALLDSKGNTLKHRVNAWMSRIHVADEEFRALREATDKMVFSLYGIDDAAAHRTRIAFAQRQTAARAADESDAEASIGGSHPATNDTEPNNDGQAEENAVDLVSGLISYAVGCIFGRWDIRVGTGRRAVSVPPDPFAPLPKYPPGMLLGDDASPALNGPPGYPLTIKVEGIVVEDPEHPDDILRRVREILDALFPDHAQLIEAEAAEVLGVESLRDYLHRASGFFADHFKLYSRSRREAPLYWPLSSASGTYTLWIYYQRLNGDLLYRAVNDYVDAKIAAIQRREKQLEGNLASAVGREAAKLRDELETVLALHEELRDMRVELLRVAALPYKPNLNDGVLLTAAPLWKLFRLPKWRKDLQECWKKVEGGEYDWSHLSYAIWPDRVREKCKTDRSLAIAHGLEDLWEAANGIPTAKPPKRRLRNSSRSEQLNIGEAQAKASDE